VELDGGPEVNAGQEVELEEDAGPRMNSVQELEVDGGQGLGRGQGLEVDGRQEVEVELDGVQDVKQDVDGRQEVNRRRRRVGDYLSMRWRHTSPVTQKHLQTSSVLLTNGSYAMYVIEY
jgi:hypothetical protein